MGTGLSWISRWNRWTGWSTGAAGCSRSNGATVMVQRTNGPTGFTGLEHGATGPKVHRYQVLRPEELGSVTGYGSTDPRIKADD
ncbi:MAG: hypothetical protein CM15mP65_01380 [Crocinitomicaceae bacterium]|nr:MAG: hypothetical protein CM15mP65_01380 [Crocinitomicaceae bacterium]